MLRCPADSAKSLPAHLSRQGGVMPRWITTLGAVLCTLVLPGQMAAQVTVDDLTPSAISDSTYAVRLAIERLAEAIRRGKTGLDVYHYQDIAAAAAELAAVAAQRALAPPHLDLGTLWDFRIEIVELRAVSPAVLEARTRTLLSTDEGSAGPATLVFRRFANDWVLAEHESFKAQLQAITLRLVEGAGR